MEVERRGRSAVEAGPGLNCAIAGTGHERYFPHASHQVIILSTDTEIEVNYFEQLKPSLARAYHLSP